MMGKVAQFFCHNARFRDVLKYHHRAKKTAVFGKNRRERVLNGKGQAQMIGNGCQLWQANRVTFF